ncbi:MAG: hypothetical protein EA406_02795 [Rhodospirillales bacterium]|nr:MAG: hypothetical protein EA406_02795 [Rhodospirillales bacterium]
MEPVGNRAGRTRDPDFDSAAVRLGRFLGRIPAEGADLYAVQVDGDGPAHPACARPGRTVLGAALQAFAAAHGARLFLLSGGTMVLVCGSHVPVDRIEAILGDPAPKVAETGRAQAADRRGAIGGQAGEGSPGCVAAWYDLSDPDDLRRLRAIVQQREAAFRRHSGVARADAGSARLGRLDPGLLAELARRLPETDPRCLVRSGTVVRLSKAAEAVPRMRRFQVDVDAIGERLAPGIDLAGGGWLLRALLERTDRLMLAFAETLPPGQPGLDQGIDLNLATFTGPAFRRMQDLIAGPNRRASAVGLPLVDVLEGRHGYERARAWLRDRGCRVMITGVCLATPSVLDVAKLDAEIVALRWEEEVAAALPDSRRRAVAGLVESLGPDNVILVGTDAKAALEWGAPLGLRCFQGRFVERLIGALKPAATIGVDGRP